MVNYRKIRAAISIGDPNGVGIEIILKSFSKEEVLEKTIPIVFGSHDLMINQARDLSQDTSLLHLISDINNAKEKKINILNIFDSCEYKFGVLDKSIAEFGILSFTSATNAVKNQEADVLITSPINKNAAYSSEFKFSGQTDYLSSLFNVEALMLMVSEDLKIALTTDHIPLKEVHNALNTDLIKRKILILDKTLKDDFEILNPKIAVLAINPHAGDDGVIGDDDGNITIPVINKLNESNYDIQGPFPSDTFFSNEGYKQYDAVLAAYHDQGLIPFKTINFGKGVNFSAGLPIIRTSPDHGTAYDIAGQNIANPASFINAVKIASNIYFSRNNLISK